MNREPIRVVSAIRVDRLDLGRLAYVGRYLCLDDGRRLPVSLRRFAAATRGMLWRNHRSELRKFILIFGME